MILSLITYRSTLYIIAQSNVEVVPSIYIQMIIYTAHIIIDAISQ